jgi:hypothetical protein
MISDDTFALPMDFAQNPETKTPWSQMLRTGRGMIAHFAAAPDAQALADARLLLAQYAMASSRQPVPAEHRAQWAADIHSVCEDLEAAISARSAELTAR